MFFNQEKAENQCVSESRILIDQISKQQERIVALEGDITSFIFFSSHVLYLVWHWNHSADVCDTIVQVKKKVCMISYKKALMKLKIHITIIPNI
jgi:hypothetical protein